MDETPLRCKLICLLRDIEGDLMAGDDEKINLSKDEILFLLVGWIFITFWQSLDHYWMV